MKVYLHTQSDSPNQFFVEVIFNRAYNGGGDQTAEGACYTLAGVFHSLGLTEKWSEYDREVGDDEWSFKAAYTLGQLSLGEVVSRLVTDGYTVEVTKNV